HLEQHRVYVVGPRKQDVFLGPSLPAVRDEFIAVLEVVVALDRSRHVIARVKRRTVECFNQTYLILLNHCRVHQPHIEQPRLSISAAFEWNGGGQYAIGAGRQNIDLRSLLSARPDELLGVLEVAMIVDRFRKQPARVELRAISRGDDPDLSVRDHRRFCYRDSKQVRVNRPKTRRQRAKLNAFDSAAFDECDGILKIVVRVLRAIGCEDSTGRHRLPVDGFDYAHLIGSDLDQWEFPDDFLEGPFDQVQAGFEHVGLYADLAFGSDDAAG